MTGALLWVSLAGLAALIAAAIYAFWPGDRP